MLTAEYSVTVKTAVNTNLDNGLTHKYTHTQTERERERNTNSLKVYHCSRDLCNNLFEADFP